MEGRLISVKKFFAVLLTLAMVLSLAACGGKDSGSSGDSGSTGGDTQQQEPASTPSEDGGSSSPDMKVAMITDYGDITDQSFNQTTYEACKEYCDGAGLDFKYYKPNDNSTAGRVAMVDAAVADGYNIIVMPEIGRAHV